MVGIYGIKNKVTGKIYVGQSVNIPDRWTRHRYQLRHNIHFNDHLQRSFNKHGEVNFDFVVLKYCDVSELDEAERNAIVEHTDAGVYNTQLDPKDVRGERNPFYGKTHSLETRKLLSELRKGKYIGEANPNFGRSHSVESKEKISANRGTLSREDVLSIVERLKQDESHSEIANDFNISRTVVTRISNGTRWSNITGGPVVPVVYENGKRKLQESHKKRIGESHLGMKYKSHKDEV